MTVDYDGSDARIEERRAGVVAKSCKSVVSDMSFWVGVACNITECWSVTLEIMLIVRCDSQDAIFLVVWHKRWTKNKCGSEMSFLSMCDYWHCVRNRCDSRRIQREKGMGVAFGWCLEQCGILKVRTPKWKQLRSGFWRWWWYVWMPGGMLT
jgi:hypothetical protein